MAGEGKRPWVWGLRRDHECKAGAEGSQLWGGGATEGPQLHTYPEGSSGSGSPALRQGSLKSWLKELGSILATSGRRAAVRGTGMIKDTPGRAAGTAAHGDDHAGGQQAAHVTFGRPAGRVLPQAAAALLEVRTRIPSVPGRDSDLAAAGPAANPARGAAPAPRPPGPHSTAHRCQGWRRGKRKSFSVINDGKSRAGEMRHRGWGEGRKDKGQSDPSSPSSLTPASAGAL